jgi:uncharacterized protein GlcG (DUF336 family)
VSTISTERADEIIRRACARAEAIGMAACIAVVDAGAHLKAFRRMDGAFAGAVDVSQRKARTSALFLLPSGDFGRVIAEHRLTGMELANGGLAAFHGGLPIMEGEVLVGAVGVSGGSAEQDLDVARHALGMGGQP